MNGDMNESSFLLAAAKNIRDLEIKVTEVRLQATEAREAADLARKSADKAKTEATRWQRLTKILGVVTLVTLVAVGAAIYNWVQAQDATNQLRAQAIAGCQQGNDERAAQVQVWNFILGATLAGSKNAPPAQKAATIKFVHDTEQVLAEKLAPRNCAQAFDPRAAR